MWFHKPWKSKTKQRMVFWMIHVKDSRSYQWAKFGLWTSWVSIFCIFTFIFPGANDSLLTTGAYFSDGLILEGHRCQELKPWSQNLKHELQVSPQSVPQNTRFLVGWNNSTYFGVKYTKVKPIYYRPFMGDLPMSLYLCTISSGRRRRQGHWFPQQLRASVLIRQRPIRRCPVTSSSRLLWMDAAICLEVQSTKQSGWSFGWSM